MYLFVTNMRRVWIEVFVYNKLGCDMNLLVANMRRVWIEVADNIICYGTRIPHWLLSDGYR